MPRRSQTTVKNELVKECDYLKFRGNTANIPSGYMGDVLTVIRRLNKKYGTEWTSPCYIRGNEVIVKSFDNEKGEW